MIITDEMVAAASAVAPTMDLSIIRKILESGLAGQIVISVGEGEAIIGGKNKYPDIAVVRIGGTYEALDVARHLITAVQHNTGKKTLEPPVELVFSGTARIALSD